MSITLPQEEGAYKLDVLNSDSQDPNEGAAFSFGFGGDDLGGRCTASNGCLEGGSLVLTVVPEPATLWLVALGMYGLLHCKRGSR